MKKIVWMVCLFLLLGGGARSPEASVLVIGQGTFIGDELCAAIGRTVEPVVAPGDSSMPEEDFIDSYFIIEQKSDLDALRESCEYFYSDGCRIIERLSQIDETYFERCAVGVISVWQPSGSNRVVYVAHSIEKGTAAVTLRVERPFLGTDDIACNLLFLQLPADTVTEIKVAFQE